MECEGKEKGKIQVTIFGMMEMLLKRVICITITPAQR